MTVIISIIASVAACIISGGILFFIQRHFKRVERSQSAAEDRRVKKDVLVLKCLKAIGQLTTANATAIKQGHCNGEIDQSKKAFESVETELDAFLLEQAVKKVNTGGKR